jgi:CRISPR-associated exonuclease Cas4
LIHIEGLWAENRLTVEGRHLHDKAHEGPDEMRGDVRIVRGLALRSLRLGLIGKADVVEFHPPAPRGGSPRPFPVEYKRGRPKAHDADRVQLCAQGLCLEEMLGVPVGAGALFYGRTRRRQDVAFDDALRRLTEQTAERLHALIATGRTPRAVREPKCDRCSLLDLCLPGALAPRRSATRYFERAVTESLGTGPEGDR